MTPYGSTMLANDYFRTRLHTRAWDNASETDRYKALCDMTRRINRLNFAGQKADPTQENEFPRRSEYGETFYSAAEWAAWRAGGALRPYTDDCGITRYPPLHVDLVVPQAILEATYEGALALLDGYDPEKEYANLSSTSDKFQGVGSTYDRRTLPEHVVAGIPSIAAWQLIQPYLRAARNVVLRRV